MAMRTASPWWLTLVLAGGLLFFFLGERPFDHVDVVGNAMTGLGLVAVLAATGARVLGMLKATGQKRAVEKLLVLCHVGVVLAIILYAASTGWGRDLLGKAPPPETGLDKYGTSLRVLWGILLLISFVPLCGASCCSSRSCRWPWPRSRWAPPTVTRSCSAAARAAPRTRRRSIASG
jgi:hypothetical protein